MKLLRKSLLLTVVFGGYLFWSIPSTTQGFIALVGIYDILVKKVHEPKWRIGYNFTLGCAAAFELQGEDKLKAAITESLQVWLQPLRERYPNKVFTDDFIFVRMPDIKACFDDRKQRQQVDLRITFGCKVGVRETGVLTSGFSSPDVCMVEGTDINDQFYLYTLAHELGHAFGLGDTYIRGTYPSTGGLAATLGKQPSSIMAGLPGLLKRRQFPYLKEDDKNGIIYLYKYYHEDYPKDDCFFSDYVPVETRLKTRRACEPRYPLIHEVRYASEVLVEQILRDDPTLELNGQDSSGFTALHHAVQRGNIKVVEVLLAQAGIKANLLNTHKRTPAQLARVLKQTHLAKLIEAHPTANWHPVAWNVAPKGKLTTTWGHLKKRY